MDRGTWQATVHRVPKSSSQRDRGIHNCKPFLVSAVRKRDQQPVIRCWLEQMVACFDNPELFQTGTGKEAMSSRHPALGC